MLSIIFTYGLECIKHVCYTKLIEGVCKGEKEEIVDCFIGNCYTVEGKFNYQAKKNILIFKDIDLIRSCDRIL